MKNKFHPFFFPVSNFYGEHIKAFGFGWFPTDKVKALAEIGIR